MISVLKAEAERKEVVFRRDFDETQRRGFPPFVFFAWETHIDEFENTAAELEAGEITLEEAHDRVGAVMEQYYGCPYP